MHSYFIPVVYITSRWYIRETIPLVCVQTKLLLLYLFCFILQYQSQETCLDQTNEEIWATKYIIYCLEKGASTLRRHCNVSQLTTVS